MKEIYLAGGCFWGTEKYIASIQGVLETAVGYANGLTENPTYEQVKKQEGGHVETVKVIYEESIVSLSFLLELFYESINPTSVNKQGEDEGIQYRTGIYYNDSSDIATIEASIKELEKEIGQKTAIEVKPLDHFYLAEEYHQKYLDKNPTGYCHVSFENIQRVKEMVDKRN